MKKSELIKRIDKELLEALTGFSYKRTNNSLEAQELCSDIIYEIVKASYSEGEITSDNGFIWTIARNTYFEYINKKSSDQHNSINIDDYTNNFQLSYNEFFDDDESAEQLMMIYREIAFLTKSYREVMISYYLNNKSIHDIAIEQNTSENTIRQRLFAARENVRKGVSMEKISKQPITFEEIDYEIIGTGAPATGDPRNVCYRLLSKHVVWLCRNKAVTAKSISEKLNVPMPYIENELECQVYGENGKYGLLKKLDNGRYTTNFILLDEYEIKEMWDVYTKYIPLICNRIKEYVTENKDRYMSFPYLNRKIDFNLVLWQHIATISTRLESLVRNILENEYFKDVKKYDRPFSVFGYKKFDESNTFGCGHDGIQAKNLCGYSQVSLDNIYLSRLKPHFHCGHDIANDMQIQLAIRAINGINLCDLDEIEKESAAKAIEVGYLYMEDTKLYTKILTSTAKSQSDFQNIDNGISEYFKDEAIVIAKQIYECISKFVPDHLICDYPLANMLGAIPVIDLVVDNMIKENMLKLPENGLGAEGCSMWLHK